MIWNPWAEYAKEIPDFGDDEFPNMVCVEAGRVAAPIVLLPGTAFEASQILQVRWTGHALGIVTLFVIAQFPVLCPRNA